MLVRKMTFSLGALFAAATLSSTSVLADDIITFPFFSRSDQCEGRAAGVILVSMVNGQVVCKTLGSGDSIWSVKMGDTCVDNADTRSAQDFCDQGN